MTRELPIKRAFGDYLGEVYSRDPIQVHELVVLCRRLCETSIADHDALVRRAKQIAEQLSIMNELKD